jgi:hypothetical protein
MRASTKEASLQRRKKVYNLSSALSIITLSNSFIPIFVIVLLSVSKNTSSYNMFVLPILITFMSLLLGIGNAAQSFAGSDLYYAAGLSTADQNNLFTALQSADSKALRVWLDGQSSS